MPGNILFEGGRGIRFITCYYRCVEIWSEENPEGRWRKYSVKEIKPVWIFSGLKISLLLI